MNENLISIPLEQAVLTSLLTLSSGLDDVFDKLTDESFYATKHKAIFNVILDQYKNGDCHDVLVICELMRPKFDSNLNEQYFKDLMSSAGSSYLLSSYVDELNELMRRRSLFSAGELIKVCASDIDQYDSISAVSRAESILSDLENNKESSTLHDSYNLSIDLFKSINDRVEARAKGIEIVKGVKTGLTELDRKIGTIAKTDLVIIGARPSMGKSAFMQCLGIDISFFQQLPVLIHSAEMSKDQVGARLVASLASINLRDIRDAKIPDEKWGDFVKATEKLKASKLFIDDMSKPSLSDIRRNCRMMKQKHGSVGAVIIDYLTLMTSPIKTDNMHQAVGALTKGLKGIAKEFDCPVFCLAQLSRKVEDRKDKRPMLSDLRESGSIEEDANIILFLYRDEYYNKNSQDLGVAEIIAAKVRDGEVGTIRVASELQYSRFSDLDESYYHQQESFSNG